MNREPVLIVDLIASLIALAVAFGVPLVEDQRAAIIGFVIAAQPVFLIIRQMVFAPNTVERIEQQAALTGRVSPNLAPPQG